MIDYECDYSADGQTAAKPNSQLGAGSKAILVLAAVVIVAAGIKLSAAFLVPLLVAACVASAMAPIVDWLRRFGLPTHLAVTLTIVNAPPGMSGTAAGASVL